MKRSLGPMKHQSTVFPYRSLTTILPILALTGAIPTASAEPADDPAVQAQAYLDEWNAKGPAACEAKDAACDKLGESLYNAASAFQRAGERNKAIAARLTLIDPRYHLDSSIIGKKTLFQLGEDYKAIAEYARAADFYEMAVNKAPSEREAPSALMDATIFRLSLGEMDKATKNVEVFEKVFGVKKAAESVTMWIGLSVALIEHDKFKEAKPILEKIVPRAGRDGELRDKFVAHQLLATVLTKMDDSKGADREFAAIRALWRDPGMQSKLQAEADSNPRNVGKILNVVGEAMFFAAEAKRKEADAIRYPAYTGPANKDDVLKHINTKVVDWIKKKRPAIEEAEKAYHQVLDLQPVAPPRWVVASASRVGTMWGKFVAEFRAAPIPKDWKKHGPVPGAKDLTFDELRKEYYERIDEAVEPQKMQAKKAFKLCVDYSIKFESVDEFSRSCRAWLEKNYRTEFVQVDELIPAIRPATTLIWPSEVLPDPRASK